MYGLVNRAIEDLAHSLGGEQLWADVCHRAGMEPLTFVGLDSYDDEITYRLVDGAAHVLGLTPEQVLEAFGEHWVRYTGRQGYGPLLASYGSDLGEFLGNLDALHRRVQLTMPQLQPPSFHLEQPAPDVHVVHYRSTRVGLGPMVVGLLRGVGALFGREVRVERLARTEDGADHDVFSLTDVGPASPAPEAGAASDTTSPSDPTPAPA